MSTTNDYDPLRAAEEADQAGLTELEAQRHALAELDRQHAEERAQRQARVEQLEQRWAEQAAREVHEKRVAAAVEHHQTAQAAYETARQAADEKHTKITEIAQQLLDAYADAAHAELDRLRCGDALGQSWKLAEQVETGLVGQPTIAPKKLGVPTADPLLAAVAQRVGQTPEHKALVDELWRQRQWRQPSIAHVNGVPTYV